jgi:excisionase family DNA binding protein
MTALVVSSEGMTPRIDTAKLVTVPQAAKLLSVTRAAIHKAIKRGRLPHLELGGVFLIQRADLTKYKKNKSVGGRPKKKS